MDIRTETVPQRSFVESGIALLAGMLPPSNQSQVWSSYDRLAPLWQPVAVNTAEFDRSWKTSVLTPCRTAELVENITITEVPELKHFLAANRDVIRRLEVLTGEDFTNDRSWIWIAKLYDTYIKEQAYFGPSFYPPRWADPKTLSVLKEAFRLQFSIWAVDQAYLRLRGGPLLNDILEAMVKAASNKAVEQSIQLFGIYSRNVAIVEHALGIFRGKNLQKGLVDFKFLFTLFR